MPHIALNSDEPGIRGLLRFRPETAVPLNQLAEVLLRGESTLSRGERELIGAYVSSLNRSRFCSSSHAGPPNTADSLCVNMRLFADRQTGELQWTWN